MGNGDSIIKQEEIKRNMERNPNFIKLKERANQLSIEIIIQSDCSISIFQLQNGKNNRITNSVIPGPKSIDEIDTTLNKIAALITEKSKDSGQIHFGYQ